MNFLPFPALFYYTGSRYIFFFRSPCGQYSQNVLLRRIHHRGTELSRKRSGLSEIFYYQLVITLSRYSCIRRVGTERGRSARHFASEAEEFCQCFRPHHDGQGIREAGSDNPSDHPFLESLPQWGVTRFLLQHHLACRSSYSGNSQRPYSVPTQDSTLLRNQSVFELTPQTLAVQTP